MAVLALSEAEIRSLIGPVEALREVRSAFAALARGKAILPSPIGFDIPEHGGEVHVKGAYLRDSPFYSIKIASGFYQNSSRNLPVTGGMIAVFDASTGMLHTVLFDNGYLTELRTGAAGALAAELLARENPQRVGILGAGGQARFQLQALCGVRRVRRVVVYGRSTEKTIAYAREMESRLAVRVLPVATAREAVEGSDVVITATPSREPIIRGEWISAGMHITAVGSDGPNKQELDVGVLARADKIVPDSLEQCLKLGELHHAVLSDPSFGRIYCELGELAAGLKPGRTSEQEITVADLTGVGIQDAAVANFVVTEAGRIGAGRLL
jgi:ornithine cyclodeaminase/alanine dehydrogenase-like protein (mu-crystallin family)